MPCVAVLRVAHVDAPVRLHGRGEEPPQRPEEAEAEVAVLEREKREECMLSLGAQSCSSRPGGTIFAARSAGTR